MDTRASGAGSSGWSARRSRRAVMRAGAVGTAAASAAALAFAGCAPGGEQSAAPSEKAVTLRFVPAGFHADLDQIVVDQYHAENPHVTISFEPIPTTYVDKITAMQAGDNLPDVIYVADAHVKPFAANKIAADMEKLAAKDKASQALLKDVYPAMLDLGRVKSIPGQYMLPWALDVLVLYYNKTMFQQAGVELPKPTWTVDDMITAAKRLTKEAETPAAVPVRAAAELDGLVRVRALDAGLRRGPGQRGRQEADDRLPRVDRGDRRHGRPGHAAQGGAADRDGLRGQRLPAGQGGDDVQHPQHHRGHPQERGRRTSTGTWSCARRSRASGSPGWAPPARASPPRRRTRTTAWNLAKYTISPAAQKIYATSYGSIPVLQSMRNDPSWRSLPAPPANADAFVKAADNGTLPPDTPLSCGTVYVGDLNVLMTQTLTDIVNGKVAANAGLRDAAAQVSACMAKSTDGK